MKTEYLKKDFYMTNEFFNSEKTSDFIAKGIINDVFPKLLSKLVFDGEHIVSVTSSQYNTFEEDTICVRVSTGVTKIIRCRNCGNKDKCKNYQFFGDDGFCSWGELETNG